MIFYYHRVGEKMKKNIKKGYIITGLGIFILVIAGVLSINKPSYAESTSENSSCPAWLDIQIESEEISYVRSASNKITLPKNIYHNWDYESYQSSQKESRLFAGDLSRIYAYKIIYYGENEVEYDSYCADTYNFIKSDETSTLMGTLINDSNFVTNDTENNYYKQLLILWSMDRLAGYDDNKNYIYDGKEIIEISKDVNYKDKYNIEEWTSGGEYTWKYINHLSAGDKELLKSSPIGDKMIKYLDTWEKYINWYLDENQKVEMDSIVKENISYYVTNEYIETNPITPKSTGKVYSNKFDSYEVQVSEPMIVVDKNGEEKTTFNAGESFRVRIPISEIKNKTLNYDIEVKGNFKFPAVTLYSGAEIPCRFENAGKERLQLYNQLTSSAFLIDCMSEEHLNTSLNIEFNQQVGNLDVKVIDASTGDNLSKAEVVIYDNKNNIVYRYETTEKELNIILPVGDYTVKQTVTPPNYEAKTIETRVKVTENNTSEAVLENIPLVSVPDTNKTSGYMPVVGFIVLIMGILILGVIIKNKKHE